jgi:putative ABC transport system permease protein
VDALRRIAARLREFVAGPSVDRDLSDEVQSHIDHLIDEYTRRGVPPDEARRRAVRDFGGIDQTKESIRDTRGLPMLEHLLIDIRRAGRSLAKARGFTAVAIITLALGVGANAAIFSVFDTVVLRPLPYPDAGRLVSIYEANTGVLPDVAHSSGSILGGNDDPNRITVAPANYVVYRSRISDFAGMAGFAGIGATLTGTGAPERFLGEEVTANYFDVLGVRPALGRPFTEADASAGAPEVVVISDGIWHGRFGGDPTIVGRVISLDDRPREVVGVMPADFSALSQFGARDAVSFWTPAYYPPDLLANHADHEINVVARLADGATIASAAQALTGVSEDLAQRFPDSNKTMRAFVRPLHDDIVRGVSTSLGVIMLMVVLILLIACANVANLMIVRGAGRRREVAIRYALGASRGRVMSEMVTESLLLVSVACVAGLVLATWMKDVLVALAPQTLPRLNRVALNGRVLAFSVIVAVVTGVMFGMLPAWQTRKARPADALRSGDRAGASRWMMRWRNGLLIAELALSTVLLVGAGLMVRSLVALDKVDLGFRTDHVMAMNVNLPMTRYRTGDDRLAFFQALETKLSAVPGVARVAFANRFPMRGAWTSGFEIDGVTNHKFVDADFQAVSPGYFDTLGLRLTHGRLLENSDIRSGQPVAVVSEAFSTVLLAGRKPLGVRFRRDEQFPWITVVGVIADVRRDGKKATMQPQVYLAAAQTQLYPVRLSDVAVLLDARSGDVRSALQNAVWAVDKDQPIANLRTLDEVVGLDLRDQRFQATLVGLFAVLALALAVVGIHGVVSYVVAQRTAEIGVRTALGADQGTIMRWLLGGTAIRVFTGAAIGVAGALLLSKYLASLLFQVTPTDAVTYASAPLALCTVALASAAVAARRAADIDPVKALRGE